MKDILQIASDNSTIIGFTTIALVFLYFLFKKVLGSLVKQQPANRSYRIIKSIINKIFIIVIVGMLMVFILSLFQFNKEQNGQKKLDDTNGKGNTNVVETKNTNLDTNNKGNQISNTKIKEKNIEYCDYAGTVIDTKKHNISGVSIYDKNNTLLCVSDETGNFKFSVKKTKSCTQKLKFICKKSGYLNSEIIVFMQSKNNIHAKIKELN